MHSPLDNISMACFVDDEIVEQEAVSEKASDVPCATVNNKFVLIHNE